MRPKSEPKYPQRELFQSELEQMIDMHHPLVRLDADYGIFGIYIVLLRAVKGGFFLMKKPLISEVLVYSNSENAIERNRLKGIAGDSINAILSAAAMNFHKLLGAS